MTRFMLIALMLVPAVTRADDGVESIGQPKAYAAVGGTVGENRYDFHGIAGELGMRLGRTPLFGRVMAGAGNTKLTGDPGRGTYVEGRVGAEGRLCRYDGVVCGSLGLDVGAHHGSYQHVDLQNQLKPIGNGTSTPSLQEDFDATVLAPRLTIDGGARVRVRGVIEMPSYITDHGSVTGIAASLSLGVGW
jgi:hypothetical protein